MALKVKESLSEVAGQCVSAEALGRLLRQMDPSSAIVSDEGINGFVSMAPRESDGQICVDAFVDWLFADDDLGLSINVFEEPVAAWGQSTISAFKEPVAAWGQSTINVFWSNHQTPTCRDARLAWMAQELGIDLKAVDEETMNIKASMPPFNTGRNIDLPSSVFSFNVPVDGPSIPNSVMKIFDAGDIRDLAKKLLIRIPSKTDCLTDVVNIIFAMMGIIPNDLHEDTIVAYIDQFRENYFAKRDFSTLWVPSYFVMDAGTDDYLAWVILVCVHESRGTGLRTFVQFPADEDFNRPAARLEQFRGVRVFRDPQSKNKDAVKLNMKRTTVEDAPVAAWGQSTINVFWSNHQTPTCRDARLAWMAQELGIDLKAVDERTMNIKASMPPFNIDRNIHLPSSVLCFNVPVYGPNIAYSVMKIFDADDIRDLAKNLFIIIPSETDCLTDVVNLIFAMMGIIPNHLSEHQVADYIDQFRENYFAKRDFSALWVPSYFVMDAGTDDSLAWVILVCVHESRGTELKTFVQFPADAKFDRHAYKLERFQCVHLFRDPQSKNNDAVMQNMQRNMGCCYCPMMEREMQKKGLMPGHTTSDAPAAVAVL